MGLYIGLMSGTSLDGLDIALCDFDTNGVPSLLAATTTPLPKDLAQQLAHLSQIQRLASNQPQSVTNDNVHLQAVADRQFAEFSASAVNQFIWAQQQAGVIQTDSIITAIGSHGQTIRHWPTGETPYTVQIGCPSTLAALTGIDVIADFRQKDIALGGQGAPLAPAFHRAVFAQTQHTIGVLNIGGIANLTLLAADSTLGFDTGPGNCLLDSWFVRHHPESAQQYDADGHFAQQGEVVPALLESLLADPFFSLTGPKSTGREYFNLAWLDAWLQQHPASLSHTDVQRTLLELSARTVVMEIQRLGIQHCYVCGGGVHNTALMQRISELATAQASCQVHSTEVLGVAPDWVEALAFAWLAWSFVQRRPSSLASVTGASRDAVLGGLFPAA